MISLEPGEEIQQSLAAFISQKRLPSAFFQGIGTLCSVELGFFNVKKKEYEHHFFKDNYELITASGNISMEDDVPIVHTHALLSDNRCQTIGGHLFKGTVVVSVELFLFPVDIVLLRKNDKRFNFKALDLPHHFVKN